MSGSLDDWALVSNTLREFGEGAWLQASRRAEACRRLNDGTGHETWLRVQRTIEEIIRIELDDN